MNKTEILVIGKNEDVLLTIVSLINKNSGWNGVPAGSDEEAIEKFHQWAFDIVLLTKDITAEEEKKLQKIFTFQNPDVIIIDHSDGANGLLSNKITESLDKRSKNKKPSFSFVDDALKNAKLNINIQ